MPGFSQHEFGAPFAPASDMSCRSLFGCLVALVFVCACGGVSRVDHPGLGNETAGSASGGQGSAGWSAEGRGGGASGGRNGAGGAGRPSTCAQFKDEAPQSAWVVIVNDTLAPIYMGSRVQSCGAPSLYEVRDASDTVVARPDPCGSPCQSWLAGEPIGGCTSICRPSEVTKLDAGESINIQWSGLYRSEAQLPSACNASELADEAPVSCSVQKRIEPGSYSFYANAGSGYSCNDNAIGCGQCVPGATGGCTLFNAIVTGAELIAQSLIQLDPGYGISGSAGNANMSGKPLPIELVFRRPL